MKFTNQKLRSWIWVAACFGMTACDLTGDEALLDTTQAPIIGGDETIPGEWPWQAQINNGGSPWCGGSILSENWVLTAAHCVDGVPVGQLEVNLGLHTRSAPGPEVQTRGVSNSIIHPDWAPFSIENDVALLQLDAPVAFDQYVQPIAVEENVPPVGTPAYVTGWGQTAPGSSAADVLMEARLPVEDTATCNSAGTLPLPVQDSMLCAGFVGGEHGGCHGDSGGPLVVASGFANGWRQVGVVSWGVGGSCSSYTVFARLSELSGWISGVVGAVPVIGDVTGDSCVDIADHAAVLADYGMSVPPGNPAADLNNDGMINIFDRLIVLQNFGEGC